LEGKTLEGKTLEGKTRCKAQSLSWPKLYKVFCRVGSMIEHGSSTGLQTLERVVLFRSYKEFPMDAVMVKAV